VSGRARPPRVRGVRLGQHFLAEPSVAQRVVDDADLSRSDRVVDLGAGTGALTRAIAMRAGQVLAVELDGVLAAQLAGDLAGLPNVCVIEADLTTVPLPRSDYRVVANIPFDRTSAVLHRLLDDPCGALVRADLVVQWQVARARVRAEDGNPDLVGVAWAPWWTFARGRRLPRTLFRPAPSVGAAVLVVRRRERALLPPGEARSFAEFVRRRFASVPATSVEAWVEQYRRAGRR
jgi:23S rRNA (adenine-N6)-dimethyltransferase